MRSHWLTGFRTYSPAAVEGGFTLLEAIVAMTIMSGAGLVLFAWINSNLSTLDSIREANLRSEAETNVLEYMRVVNPMLVPEGGADLGAYRIRWTAQPAGATVDIPSSIYQFGMYRTRIDVDRIGGNRWFELTVQQVGYKQIRQAPGNL